MVKRKRKNNNLQYITQNTKDQATQTPLKTRDKLRCSERVNSSCSISGTYRVTLVTQVLLKLSFHNQILCCFHCLCQNWYYFANSMRNNFFTKHKCMYNFRINSGMCKRTIKTETIIQNTFNLNNSLHLCSCSYIVSLTNSTKLMSH